MKQFITYTRVSTRKQGDSGLGLEAQKRDIEIYLTNYADVPHEVIGEFCDVVSGTKDDRPQLWKAIDLAEATGATLLIAKLDRLSRKVSFVSKVMERKDLSFVVASMPNADKFQLHIYAALAEQERDFISKRTKAALAVAKSNGVVLGGDRGHLKDMNAGAVAAADDHAKQVSEQILPLRDAGLTLSQIADTMNRTGVATSRGGKWYPTTVSNVLKRVAQ